MALLQTRHPSHRRPLTRPSRSNKSYPRCCCRSHRIPWWFCNIWFCVRRRWAVGEICIASISKKKNSKKYKSWSRHRTSIKVTDLHRNGAKEERRIDKGVIDSKGCRNYFERKEGLWWLAKIVRWGTLRMWPHQRTSLGVRLAYGRFFRLRMRAYIQNSWLPANID